MCAFWIYAGLTLATFLVPCAGEEDPVDLNNEAVRLLEEGHFDQSIRKLTRALQLDPDSERILANLAAAYVKRGVDAGEDGNLFTAVEDIRTALKRTPKNIQYRYFLAVYLYRLGELPMAEEEINRALALSPTGDLSLKIRKLKGNILYLGDRLDEALTLFQALQFSYPKEVEAERMIQKIQRELAIQRDYHRDLSNFFKLLYDEKALDLNESLLMLLEKERSSVCADLNYFPRTRITVIIYRPDDFNAVTDSEGWVGGLFDRKIRIPLTASNQQVETIAQVVRHEYTHVIVYELAPGCPSWINEGLACYEQYTLGQGEKRLHDWMAHGGKPISFDDIPFSFMETGDPDIVRQYYLQSHSMMEFLISRYGLGKIRLLLRELNKNGDWKDAFQRAYNRSFDVVEEDWHLSLR
ncbi:MAG: tetratricopeptide repeat protein [Planctomycetes bacterium]|nr:tetratricopeptide repeat protein [Planctomycetota bacterium]